VRAAHVQPRFATIWFEVPAATQENIRAESEAGDPSTPTTLLRARTTVSLAEAR